MSNYLTTQEFDLDLVPGHIVPNVEMSQYDVGTRLLKIHLFSDGSVYSVPEGVQAYVVGKKPDGKIFMYPTQTSGEYCTFQITKQITAVLGKVECQLRLQKEIKILSTADFNITVTSSLLSQAVLSESQISQIEQAVETAQTTLSDNKTTRDYSQQQAQNAKNSATAAASSASAAKTSETAANDSAVLSKSWAVGGTGKRTEQDTDNSSYYAHQSLSYSNNSKTYALNSQTSATHSATSAINAAGSATASATSAKAAKTSETNAKTSETAAKTSETNAKESETNAASSAAAAAKSAASLQYGINGTILYLGKKGSN